MATTIAEPVTRSGARTMHNLIAAFTVARREFERHARAWSRDDGKDTLRTIKLGEEMLAAAIRMECAADDIVKKIEEVRK